MALHLDGGSNGDGPQDDPKPATPRSPVASLYFTLAGLAGIVLMVLGFIGGRSSVHATPLAANAATAMDPRAAMAQRNEVWRTLNDVDTAPEIAADTPNRVVSIIIAGMLDPTTDPQNRVFAMSLFLRKSVKYFSEAERGQLETDLTSGTPEQVAAAFTKIVMADKHADELLSAVLADKDRVGRYAHHQLPIPLETMPDGSTP